MCINDWDNDIRPYEGRLEGLKLTVPFKDSVCYGCRFRVGNGRCSLLEINFAPPTGAFKCYTLHPGSPEELVNDIISYLRKTNTAKAKNISKHLGLSIHKARSVLMKLEQAGVVKREKWGNHVVLYSLNEVTPKNVKKAVELVSQTYPTSPKDKYYPSTYTKILAELHKIEAVNSP